MGISDPSGLDGETTSVSAGPITYRSTRNTTGSSYGRQTQRSISFTFPGSYGVRRSTYSGEASPGHAMGVGGGTCVSIVCGDYDSDTGWSVGIGLGGGGGISINFPLG